MAMSVADLASHVRKEFSKIIVGQNDALDQLLLVVLARGHALVEGVPGLAKTLAVKSLAHIFRLQFQRVQCTPDLIPADILGGNIFEPASGTFRIHRGPIFTDLLLVDEINRMPPRTQSALLEAMEELQVTMDGATHPLPRTFTVFATQNPVEFEGTYPLPEAQLDRFLMKIRVEYPQVAQETEILSRYQGGFEARSFDQVQIDSLPDDALQSAREECARVRVEPKLLDYIVSIVRATRNSPAVSLGASPRAAISLMLVGKAVAAMEGRDFLIPDDVKSAAPPILRHRMLLKPEADLEGITPDQVVAEVLAGTAVPQ
jgi:MoxR-like ATPase